MAQIVKRFGDWLYEQRNAKGWSQRDFSDVAHVSQATASKWESGEALPTKENLQVIAGLFRVTVEQLERLIRDGIPPEPDSTEEDADAASRRFCHAEAQEDYEKLQEDYAKIKEENVHLKNKVAALSYEMDIIRRGMHQKAIETHII